MSLASNLNPIFQVGKSSLTPELTAAIGESFNNNELIKIGVLKNCFDDPRAIAEMVAERTHSQARTGDRQEDCIVQARQGQAEDRTAQIRSEHSRREPIKNDNCVQRDEEA